MANTYDPTVYTTTTPATVNALNNTEEGVFTNRVYDDFLAVYNKQRPVTSFTTPWKCVPYISLFSPRDCSGVDDPNYGGGKYGNLAEINAEPPNGYGINAPYRYVYRVTFSAEQIRYNTDYSVALEVHYHPSDGIDKVNDESPFLSFIFASKSTNAGGSRDAWDGEAASQYYAKRINGFDYYLVSGKNQIRWDWLRYMRYRFVIIGGV